MSSEPIVLLSIDDKTMTTDLDRAGYKKMGVVLKSAQTFQAAESLLNSEPIHVIVINYDYKGVDATLLIKHFKSQQGIHEIPIVVTSVQDRPRDYAVMNKAGMDLFIEQPLPRQFFIEKIKGLLDQKTREEDRLEYGGVVSFELDGQGHSCEIGDLSRTGLLIHTENSFAIKSDIQLSFTLPGYKKPIKVLGKIVREIHKEKEAGRLGYGVSFVKFQGDSGRRLERYLAKVNKDDPKLVYYL